MTLFNIFAILTTLVALFAWVNFRFVKLPPTIGVMVLAMGSSLGLVALGRSRWLDTSTFTTFVQSVDFDAALLHGMLGALLFAGGLHVNVERLMAQRGIITILATFGTVLSTAIVGIGAWWLFGALGLDIPWPWALLFGALISPTDPIAVGAILRTVGVPEELETKIAGESLFNDGVGVVIFVIIQELAVGGEHVTVGHAAELFVHEALGGIAFGAVVGWVLYRMLKSVDHYQVEILLTLAFVTGGYAFANAMHLSGPLAMVVGGIIVGNRGRQLAMSENTRNRLDAFWALVDEFLNAALFVLIGLEIIVLEITRPILVAAVFAVPLVLLARWISVATPVTLLRPWRSFAPHAITILTWSGLRGGISVALALSLPLGRERDILVTVSYVVVCFSIIGQGLTIGPLARRLLKAPA